MKPVDFLRAPVIVVLLFWLLGCSKPTKSENLAKEDLVETASQSDSDSRGSTLTDSMVSTEAKGNAVVAEKSSEFLPDAKPRSPRRPDARVEAILAALERSPLDMQRMLDGIREKYELDRIDDPKLQLADLLKRYETGDRSVLLDLGLFVAYGDASIIDPAQAKAFFEEAAVDGEARALAELGRLYLTGTGTDRDAVAAQDYFEQAMAAGDLDGTFLLGMGYRNGLFGEAEEETGLDYITTAASMGHVAAANSLFELSRRTAIELSKDKPASERAALILKLLSEHSEMEQWLQRGVENGDLASMLNLSSYYKFSNSVDKALPVLEAAAELGSFDALKDLMDMSARKFRDPEYRESFKALLQPHVEGGGNAKGEARFRLAMLEAMDGSRSTDEVRRLLGEASSIRYYKAFVALAKIDEGEPPLKALVTALMLSESDAYVQWTNRKEIDMPETDPNGKVQEKLLGDVAPVLTKVGKPNYPPELLAEALSGKVIIEVIIDENGKAVRGQVVESNHPAFDASAMEAALQMEFTPALRGGQPTAMKVRVPVYFSPNQ